jgi:peptide-methionine (S)-S-oxide reductase
MPESSNEAAVAKPWRRDLLALVLALAAVAAVALFVWSGRGAPSLPPAATATAARAGPGGVSETAVFAGGCFWGVQGVFQRVQGVSRAVSGYAGGEQGTAVYERVGRGNTGHAEAVQVTFDPRQVSYAQLLQIFFSVVHDPTQLDRQGPDVGPHYRSALFAASDEQARIATAYMAQLAEAKVYKSPIVTKMEGAKPFYAAEDYHQDFLTRHPNHPYIAMHDLPKVDELKRLFPQLYRAEPALVFAPVKAGS